jgi:group I intron endonuclease
MKIVGVYQIVNKVNGKKYIGSSVNIKARWRTHKHCLRHGNHCARHLQSAWDKYGEQSFAFEIVEECPEDLLYAVEEKYIHQWDTCNPDCGYNNEDIADGRRLVTAATRRKLSEVKKGFRHTEQSKRLIREALVGKPMHTEEFKEHLRKINTGKKMPTEAVEKMRQKLIGRHQPQEVIDKLVVAHNDPNYLFENSLRENSRPKREGTTSKCKGVFLFRNRWVATIKLPKQPQKRLGYFATEEEACECRRKAEVEYDILNPETIKKYIEQQKHDE